MIDRLKRAGRESGVPIAIRPGLMGARVRRARKSDRSSGGFAGIWKGKGSASAWPRQIGEGSDPAGRPAREKAVREEAVPVRMTRLKSPNQTLEPTRADARPAHEPLGPRGSS